jgi:DNA/RNA endonuclease G (NUC1)
MTVKPLRLVMPCFILVLVSLGISRAEVCRTAKTATADQIEAADAALVLSNDTTATAAAIKSNLPWGAPKNPPSAVHEHLLIQKDYVTDYDDDLRVSIWEGHRLRAADVKKVLKRTEAFRTDPRLADPVSATCDDYKGSGYDRGHMAPSGDFTKSLTSMLNSFPLSNMTPQNPDLNEHFWNHFESFVRFWATEYGTVWVITGAVFDQDGDGHRDPDATTKKLKDRVGVPSAYYKIITRKPLLGRIQTIAILIPHEKCGTEDCETERKGVEFKDYLADHITTVRAIEGVTGIDFFPKLSKSQQDNVETNQAPALWN